ncbi:MAG TPA: peptidase inhibitor family I36 protein, partial [Catenuloplanes sp.]
VISAGRRRRSVRRTLTAILVGFGVLGAAQPLTATSAAAAAPALRISIGAGMSSCPSGYICLWTDEGFQGYGVALRANERYFGGMPAPYNRINDTMTSIYNRTGETADLYPEANFGGADRQLTISNGAASHNIGSCCNDLYSSLYIRWRH